jgi:hypothetical protein
MDIEKGQHSISNALPASLLRISMDKGLQYHADVEGREN